MIFGVIIVAFISIVSAVLTWKLQNIVFRFLITGIVAFLAAYLAYWIPAWLSPGDDQYSSWARLFIDTWFIVGLVAGSLAVIVSSIIKNKGSKNAS